MVEEIDNSVLWAIINDHMKKEKEIKKKVSFVSNIKLKVPMEVGMMFTINQETFFFAYKEHMDQRFGCLVSYQQQWHQPYDVPDINKLVQGISGHMPNTKLSKLCMEVCPVDGSNKLHKLWPMKYCSKAGANLSLLTFKLLQGSKVQLTTRTTS